jgi:hypothetical protein
MKPYAAFLTTVATMAASTFTGIAVSAAENAWTLKTDDTHLELGVRENRLLITVLKNPAQGWNWMPAPSPVPLPGVNGKQVEWTFADAAETKTDDSHMVTLRFTCANPPLELKSVWRARPGVGPVEHQQTIRNNSAGAVAFADKDLVAADLKLVSDQAAHLFPGAAGGVGYGENTPLPYQMIQVGTAHGVYLAYDYGCGNYATTVTDNQIASRWWAAGIQNTATAPGETFRCPGIMIQTYQGDEDDGANHFRRWFWNYEITPSLKNNPQEPPIEICNEPDLDGQPDVLVRQAKTTDFASWGVGCFKTDAWHWEKGHARSDEIAAALHAKGIKLSLYFNGVIPLKILLDERAKSGFDYYRSDDYGRGPAFDMRNYHSVEEFKRKLEKLAEVGVGWENCCNGGNLRSLDICRRMTFMTHSDSSGLIPFFVNVYHWSYMMPPIQLKCDYAVGANDTASTRGYLLGAILGSSPFNAGFVGSFDKVKRIYALYNAKQRAILRGADVYRILPPPASGRWFGIQYHNTFIDKGSVLLWQNGGPASQVIKLKGLNRGATYKLTFEDAIEKNGASTGAQLMDEGVAVPMGPNASEIIWIDGPATQSPAKRQP